jgi:sensor histidine kinase YesM
MAKYTIADIIDQRKWISHLIIVSIAILTMIIFSVKSGMTETISGYSMFFLILIMQLEIFIFIASKIFREIPVGLSVKEFTRIILTKFFLFITICFLAALIIFLISRYAAAAIAGEDLSALWGHIIKFEFRNWLISTLKGLSLGAIIFIIILWQDALKREQKLKEENLIFQNETLKSQVNPHFLFNCLNTLSSLILTQPATAEEFTLRLASIYRYILENRSVDQVPLDKELLFIKDYFFLHKVRDENKIILDVNIAENQEYRILPVSLQMLVENAVKHNSATRQAPLLIEVFCENDWIIVRNNVQRMSTLPGTTKIGLKNLSERVRIVTGKSIVVEEIGNYFIVKIPLLK